MLLTNKTGEAYTENPVGRRGTRALKCWYSFEMSLLRTPRGLTSTEGNTRVSECGEDTKVRRSPQAVAYRKRCAQELGKSHPLPLQGRLVKGHAVIEARRGNSETGLDGRPTSEAEIAMGRHSETVKGNACQMQMGCLIKHSTQR